MANDDIRPGFKTALAEITPSAEVPLGGAVQLDWLGDATGHGAAHAERLTARPGRPIGSRNRRTVEWQEYILRTYGSPLEGLAHMASMPVHDLAHALGCKLLEAADLQRKCRADLAPYVHQRLPQAVEIKATNGVDLTIVVEAGSELGDAFADGPIIEGIQ